MAAATDEQDLLEWTLIDAEDAQTEQKRLYLKEISTVFGFTSFISNSCNTVKDRV